MFKLVAIAGKLRGQEFELIDGENIIGRSIDAHISLDIVGISQKHLSITVSGDAAYLKDLNSVNGTVLNNVMIKSATLKAGDIIVLPDLVLKFVLVEEKKIIIKRESAAVQSSEISEEVPEDLFGKVVYFFKHRLMLLGYGINEEYEWSALLAILLSIFVIIIVSVSIFPALKSSHKILVDEITARGVHYAEEIARINKRALENKDLDSLDTSFLENETGVLSYVFFDMDGRIIRPIQKMNDTISDIYHVRAREWANMEERQAKDTYKMGYSDKIVIARLVFGFNAQTSTMEKMAVIVILFSPSSLSQNIAISSTLYLEAICISALVSIIFFAIVYYLTIRPIDEIKEQVNQSFIGKRKSLESKYLMQEIDPIRSGINTLLQRIRELQHDESDSDLAEVEDDSPYLDTLHQFMQASLGPCMILNAQKELKGINSEAEDLTGIRESQSIDSNIIDIAPEQGFAATIIELCDQSANMVGQIQEGSYELSGKQCQIIVKGLVGRDGFCKGFYVVFKKED